MSIVVGPNDHYGTRRRAKSSNDVLVRGLWCGDILYGHATASRLEFVENVLSREISVVELIVAARIEIYSEMFDVGLKSFGINLRWLRCDYLHRLNDYGNASNHSANEDDS